MRGLGGLADAQPTIIIDSREQTPLTFTRLKSVVGTLQSGDYSYAGGEEIFACERKTVADLTSSLASGREAFMRECHRLRGFQLARLVICGFESEISTQRYRSRITPAAVWASLETIEVRYKIPVIWAGTPERAAAIIESYVWRMARETCEQANSLFRAWRDDGLPTALTKSAEEEPPT